MRNSGAIALSRAEFQEFQDPLVVVLEPSRSEKVRKLWQRRMSNHMKENYDEDFCFFELAVRA